MNQRVRSLCPLTLAVLVAVFVGGCGDRSQPEAISPQTVADAVHAVVEADRAVYASVVVNRLQDEEKVIKASAHWKDDKALPLPSQMLRLGAEKAAKKDLGFTYALLSQWPVNKQNAPKTAAEKTGLQFVVENPGKNYYTEEELGGARFFTAVYPDVAVAPACVECHNHHQDSPRTDFKLGDVMGGVVVRVPLK
jgi:hypothetical protein